MFKDGKALISDLGLARSVLVEDESLTETGAIVGSKDYMAPEQRRNPKNITKATDYYSFAVILYRLFTGELPRIGGFSSHLNNIFDQEVRDVIRKIATDLLSEDMDYRTRLWCTSIRDLNSLIMRKRCQPLA
jgi:serine/threonine protein kinase